MATLAIGGGVAAWLVMTAPQTEPEERILATKIVQVIEVSAANRPIRIEAEGSVIPTRSVTVKPEVKGLIVRHHPSLVAGGHIRQGEEIVGIDRSDYDLALSEHQAALEEAKFEVSVEAGRQVVAEREFGLLEKDLEEDDVNRSLVLREPHLAKAKALQAKAQNQIEKAQLNLRRTSVVASFNAVVITESVEIGQLVDSGDSICTLAGTDYFWVEVTIPLEDLKWVQLPNNGESGSSATVRLDVGKGEHVSWPGNVERLMGDLHPTSRMARLVIRVDDPMNLDHRPDEPNRLPLLIGSYVEVEIEAGSLESVLEVPRKALRKGNRLWVVDTESKLQIRQTEIMWPYGESLIVSNVLEAGDKLIVSDMRAALPGMAVNPLPAQRQDSIPVRSETP